jgi:hypothetical protein
VFFTLTGLGNQTISIAGANALSVAYTVSGTVDGYAAKKTDAVFTVTIPYDVADYGGTWDFTLALGDTGKTPIVYAVTIHIPFLTILVVESWPSKWVYMVGEEFDPAGLQLAGIYTDGSTAPLSGGYRLEGFDTSSTGKKNVRIEKYGIPGYIYGKDSFAITVVSAGRLVFDPELEAGHNAVKGPNPVPIGAPPTGYTVGPGRTLVVAPIKFLIPDNAEYEWKVNGVVQSSTTEYLSFAYDSFGPGDHTVTVTAKVNGSSLAAGTTTVSCVAGAVVRPWEDASSVSAEKLFSVVAPGQFGSTSARLGSYHGFGGYGGYAVFKFDHSVPKKGSNGKEIRVGGNTGPWTEPGAVWVSMDDNNNGSPDDTWYELAGTHTFAFNTLRRYAVTFYSDHTWIDNLGGGGFYPQRQGYAAYTAYGGPELTLVGTRLHDSLIGKAGVQGYADAYDDQHNSFSNAVQVDGSPVDLPFVDFVKVVTAVHFADESLGERSPEIGTPKDMSRGDPAMALLGAHSGANFQYTFWNDSSYDLIISFDGGEFDLPKKGVSFTEVKKTSSSADVYLTTGAGT